jgi:oligogalacturonide lyase
LVQSVTKTPDSETSFIKSAANFASSIPDRENIKICETSCRLAPSIAPTGVQAFCRNEIKVLDDPNYTSFKDRYYLVKPAGSVSFKDPPGGHFQFCPTDSTLGSYCHEGPWNLVTQRIWLLDFASREAKPCFRQTELDSVGHEFWTQDGFIFFDDRGPGHDGTITSSRTQAVALCSRQSPKICPLWVG